MGCDKILIAPVLLPDVIEGHANEHGNVMVVEGNTRTFMQSPTDGAPPGAPDVRAVPVVLLVPPPSKRIELPLIETGSHAWAYRLIVANWPELRIPR